MAKKSKNAASLSGKYNKESQYDPIEAVNLVRSLAFAKFDESVDVVFFLEIDARQADQLVRGTVDLPHGSGKTVRVAVFADGEQLKEAEDAGADVVGGKELAESLTSGNINFDLAIATPSMMAVVGKLGPILGPRGLMPNPKSGTVTSDVARAVTDFKAGKVEYRNDRYGNVHLGLGRVSFEAEKLVENLVVVSDEIIRSRPAAAKGQFLKKLSISSTMGPGIQVDRGQLENLIKSRG